MIRISTLIFLACSFFPNGLLGQWRASIRNVLEPDHNVACMLQFMGEITSEREVRVEIRMRKPGTYRDILKKTETVSLGKEKWFRIPIQLPPAIYEAEVEVFDELLRESVVLMQREVFLVNVASTIQVSDIYLSESPHPDSAYLHPILTRNLSSDLDTLYYFLKIASGKELQVNSSEYFYESAENEESAMGEISLYASLQAQEQTLSLRPGNPSVISGVIPLTELGEGAYLLDITLEYGQREPIQETATFYIGSNLRQQIFADLDNAIRQMTYILPASAVNELLDSPTEDARLIEFEEAWEDLYQDQAESEMVNYYSRIYEADERFTEENMPGWQTDRGKTFVLYGNPGKVEELTRNGQAYLRWVYPQWSLMFLFENRNQRYFLAE